MDKMFTFYTIIALLLLIILSPVIFAFIVLYLGSTGFTYLGFSPLTALFILLLMLIGSFINIPISRRRMIKVREPAFFGFLNRYVWRSQVISVNFGGAIIPLFIVAYLLTYTPLYPVFITLLIVTFVSFISSRFVPGVGVLAPAILPVVFAALFALLLSPEYAAETAFSSGVMGVLLGADILRLPLIRRGGVLSIGGAGVFDGIFIVGIASAILASI